MAYTPNPADVSQPVETVLAKTAAAEFRALKAYIQTIVSGGGPGAQTPGMIADFPYAIAPPGWIEADGSLKLRVDFPALWALVQTHGVLVAEAVWASGDNYGSFSAGDGATTFRIPDFRSMVRKARDNGRGFGTQVAGKYVAPRSRHKHRTSIGWDAGTGFLWNDGAGNPGFGSEVQSSASISTFSKTAPSGGTVRVMHTDEPNTGSVPLLEADWNTVASNGVITCIKT